MTSGTLPVMQVSGCLGTELGPPGFDRWTLE